MQIEAIQQPFETFKDKIIVVGEVPDIDYDWTPQFIINTVFESKDKLKKWIGGVGKAHKMVVVEKRSDFKGRNPWILFACERSGAHTQSSTSIVSEANR